MRHCGAASLVGACISGQFDGLLVLFDLAVTSSRRRDPDQRSLTRTHNARDKKHESRVLTTPETAAEATAVAAPIAEPRRCPLLLAEPH